MKNAINWFEIPVNDFDRAKKFYSSILAAELIEHAMPNMRYGILPYDMENQGVGGAIVEAPGQLNPSINGTTVYLNGGDDLSIALARVEDAGGKILLTKTDIGENGFMAHFLDTEGNKIAFHSMK
jgi:uncharacterized protein